MLGEGHAEQWHRGVDEGGEERKWGGGEGRAELRELAQVLWVMVEKLEAIRVLLGGGTVRRPGDSESKRRGT